MLRAISPPLQEAKMLYRDRALYGLGDTLDEAGSIVESSPELAKYLEIVAKNTDMRSLDEH